MGHFYSLLYWTEPLSDQIGRLTAHSSVTDVNWCRKMCLQVMDWLTFSSLTGLQLTAATVDNSLKISGRISMQPFLPLRDGVGFKSILILSQITFVAICGALCSQGKTCYLNNTTQAGCLFPFVTSLIHPITFHLWVPLKVQLLHMSSDSQNFGTPDWKDL